MVSRQALQYQVLKEIIDRLPQRDISAPYVKNGYRYYSLYAPGHEYAIYQRQLAQSAEWEAWETLLDGNERAENSEFYTLGAIAISPDVVSGQ